MPATPKVRNQVWAEAAGRCSICRKLLVDSTWGVDHASLVGEVAHIVAEQADGPRGDSAVSLQTRNSPENLLLLCLDHHKLVDDHPEQYPIELLRQYKYDHETWVRRCLSVGVPWDFNLQNLYYVNVPRLLILSRFLGEHIELDKYSGVTELRSLGIELIQFLIAFERLLKRLHPTALQIENLPMDDTGIGCVVSFSKRFRTKNVGRALERGWQGEAEMTKAPHIYCDVSGGRLILPLDPRWITTTTAGVHLSSGQGMFSGLAIVNEISAADSVIYASPLVIGQPVSPQMMRLTNAAEL